MKKIIDTYPGYSESDWKPRFASTTIEFVDPEQLLAHPDNQRIHVQLQQAQVEKLLDVLGWVDVVKVNKETGRVVDGHLRVTLAIRHKTSVPVLWLDLNEAEERAALASLDYTASKAGLDLNIMATNVEFMEVAFPDLGIVWENFKVDFDLEGKGNGNSAFEPNLEPKIGNVKVSQADLDREAINLAGKFQQAKDYIEVICPHCAEEFFLARKDL